ncbi:ABC transporter substrate-binding protein [Paenibacillus oralis]|nr:ABC transporter substrate-binding protein [Paenibacillus oralis]
MLRKKGIVVLMLCLIMLAVTACGGGAGQANSGNAGKNQTAGAANTGAGWNTASGTEGSAEAGPGSITLDQPVTIEFWHAMSGHLEEVLQQLADEFHNQSPNITVKLVAQGSYDDLSQKLMAAAKAKTSPTMSQAYSNWQTEYVANELIEDLTPYINDAKVGLSAEDQADIVKAFMDDNAWDGKTYGLPFNKSTEVLYYNQDYLDKFRLGVPATWDELKTAAAKLTTNINGKKVVGIGFENSVSGNLATYVKQAGGEYVTEDGKIAFNSPEGERALGFLYDLIVTTKTGRLAGEDGYMSDPFGRGDVAMYIGSSAGTSFVDSAVSGKFKWSTAPLPKDKAAASPFQGTNVIVFQSATPEQKLAAWEFGKFLISKEATIQWAKETGYVPVRGSALEDSEWTAFIAEHPEQKAASQQFDSAFGEPHLDGYNKLRTDVSKQIDEVLHGQKAVKEGLASAEQAALNSLKP